MAPLTPTRRSPSPYLRDRRRQDDDVRHRDRGRDRERDGDRDRDRDRDRSRDEHHRDYRDRNRDYRDSGERRLKLRYDRSYPEEYGGGGYGRYGGGGAPGGGDPTRWVVARSMMLCGPCRPSGSLLETIHSFSQG